MEFEISQVENGFLLSLGSEGMDTETYVFESLPSMQIWISNSLDKKFILTSPAFKAQYEDDYDKPERRHYNQINPTKLGQ